MLGSKKALIRTDFSTEDVLKWILRTEAGVNFLQLNTIRDELQCPLVYIKGTKGKKTSE